MRTALKSAGLATLLLLGGALFFSDIKPAWAQALGGGGGTTSGTIVDGGVSQADFDAHLNDTTNAHPASAIGSTPSGNLAATNVQSALNELQTDVDTRATSSALNAHITDTTDAHSASALTNVPSGNLAATDVQTALDELQTDINTRATTSALTTHAALTTTHGVAGDIVGTTDSQTLTNKTLGATAISGALTSSVGSGSNAVAFSTNGARLDIGSGSNDYFSSDGTTVTSPGALAGLSFTSSQASGSNAISFSTSGARLDLGGGASDYFSSNGTDLSTPAKFSAAGGLNLSTGSAGFRISDNVVMYDIGSFKMGIKGYATDVANVAAVSIGNANSITTALRKMVSFYSDNMSTEIASISLKGVYKGTDTDSTGSPGSATANTAQGAACVASGASAATITNSEVASTSRIFITPRDLDATATSFKAVAASGSFTVTTNANATSNWCFNWSVR